MFAQQETKLEQVRYVVSLVQEEELLIFVHHRVWRVLLVVHLSHIESDFLTDTLHMFIIEINSVAESLDCPLESFEIDVLELESAL